MCEKQSTFKMERARVLQPARWKYEMFCIYCMSNIRRLAPWEKLRGTNLTSQMYFLNSLVAGDKGRCKEGGGGVLDLQLFATRGRGVLIGYRWRAPNSKRFLRKRSKFLRVQSITSPEVHFGLWCGYTTPVAKRSSILYPVCRQAQALHGYWKLFL